MVDSEIEFLSENINLLVLYAESVAKKTEELFNSYGFIVDAKQLYWFAAAIRQRVIHNINLMIYEFSSFEIERNLSKVFQKFSLNLKSDFDKEIEKIRSLVKIDVKALDCWDSYKIPLFELGFDAVIAVKFSALNEAENLMRKLDEARESVLSSINQTITDLSMTPSTLIFPARARVSTYVSSI